MTRIEWTHDQKTVIGLRGHDMLISAAAGSVSGAEFLPDADGFTV